MRHTAHLFAALAALLLCGCSDITVGTNNSRPEAAILTPESGFSLPEGAALTFEGQASDRLSDPTELRVRWSSSIDGELHEGYADAEGLTEFTSSELSGGLHTITLRVLDPDGAAATDTVELEVLSSAPPSVEILEPISDGIYYSDLPVTLRALAQDAEDPVEELRVHWTVETTGDLLAEELVPTSTGETTASAELDQGSWVLVATATDSGGKTDSDSVSITVGPPNSDPECALLSPEDGSFVAAGDLVVFEGTAEDVDVSPSLLLASFESSEDGNLGAITPTSEGEITLPVAGLSAATHNITMTVQDEVGGTCTRSILLHASTPPTASILSPAVGDPVNAAEALSFSGSVHDTEDPDSSLSVVWTSDVDGDLGGSTPDSSGSVALNALAGLSAGTHLVSLHATDSAGLTGTDTVTLFVNTAPSAPSVSILPTDPDSSSPLTVSIDTAAVDPDSFPGSITYDYAWTRNGAPQAAYSGLDTVDPVDTTRDEVWEVTVTASDGQASSVGGTASATIGNSPPVLASAAVSPSVGLATQSFTVTPTGASDADGDTVEFGYQWLTDGSPAAGATGTVFVPLGMPAGTQITCEVTPSDDSSDGSPVLSSAASVNTPPTVSGIGITPLAAYETSTLTAAWTTTSDVDGQPVAVSWQWNLGGSPIAGATGATLDGTFFDRGELVSVTATPHDGLEEGSPVTSTAITILNSAPSISSVALSPSSGTETTTFSCIPSGWADADGDSPGYEYQWTVDGAPSVTTETIEGSSFDKDQAIACTVTPVDDSNAGSPVSSAPLVVGNTAPAITGVAVDPASGTESTIFTCVPSGWSDVDPADVPGYTWQWSVAGAPSVTTETIDGSSFDAGDSLTCTATPFDGDDPGTPLTSGSAQVVNSSPSIASVAIAPTSGTEATVFSCDPSGWSDADGDPEDYLFEWTVNGGSSVSTQTIDGANFDKADVLACTATPVDATSSGSPVDSGTLVVDNSPPSISSVSLSPLSGNESTVFSCSALGPSDLDPGDSVTVSYQWTVDGAPSVTSQSIDGASFDSGQAIACTATPTDGETPGSPLTSAAVVIDNSEPSIVSVVVNPGSGYEATIFSCDPSGWSDADGDPESYLFQWTVSGAPSVSTQTITGAAFDKGDLLACTATPVDASSSGAPVSSGTAPVYNTAPSISTAAISPPTGYETTTFSCLPGGWADPDPADSPGYTWQWSVNSVASATTQTLDGTAFDKGDVLFCTITPTDGDQPGLPVTSSTLIVSNTPPTLVAASITPSTATTNTTLTALPSGFADVDPADSEGYSFAWFVDGSPAGTDSPTLDGSFFSVGETVTVTVTPDDGEDLGSPVTAAPVLVLNSEPTAPGVSIAPSSPTDLVDLVCSVTAPSSDADGDPISYGFEWLLDGSPTSYITSTVPSAATAAGEEWTCEVTPNDGAVDGPPGSATVSVDDACSPSAPSWSTTYPLCIATATFLGENNGDGSGISVSSAGDVDNDGADDVLIGAYLNDETGTDAGKSYLFFSSTIAAGGSFDLSSADVTFLGEYGDDRSGLAVSSAGDVDGDDRDDILIGAYWNDENGNKAGKTYLFFGSMLIAGGVFDLSVASAAFLGESFSDYSGQAVSSAGDVDDDGFDDILIGAYYNDDGGTNSGKAYLYLGTTINAQLSADPTDSTFLLDDADASFVGESPGDYAGYAVASAGDVDGDLKDDILIGAYANDSGGVDSGKSYLFLGSDIEAGGEFDLSTAFASFVGETTMDNSGRSISSAGDVDNDGYDDILIGAHTNDDTDSDAGKSYLFFGSSVLSGGTYSLLMADATFLGELADDRSGVAVSSAGDIDGDGGDDLLIGAYWNDEWASKAGKTYLIYSSTVGAGGIFELLDADAAFLGDAANDLSGLSLSGAGDVDNDGLDDILIGAPNNDEGGGNSGKTYLLLSPF